MTAARVAGFLVLGSALLMAGFLGAPAVMLAVIGCVIGATAFLPSGNGAQAISNLSLKRCNRDAWQAHWSEGYLEQTDRMLLDRLHSRRRTVVDIPPTLLPDDLRESKEWLRTLAEIRRLPEQRSTQPARRWRGQRNT